MPMAVAGVIAIPNRRTIDGPTRVRRYVARPAHSQPHPPDGKVNDDDSPSDRSERWHRQNPNAYWPVGLAACSSASMRILALTPPGEENPPALPSAPSTRWHGMISGMGLAPIACPTARDIATSPRMRAIAP